MRAGSSTTYAVTSLHELHQRPAPLPFVDHVPEVACSTRNAPGHCINAMPDLIGIITATDPAVRNQSLDSVCSGLSVDELLRQCAELDTFRRRSDNLYQRVRALFFLYAIHRFHLPAAVGEASRLTRHVSCSAAPSKPYVPLAPKSHESGSLSLIPFAGYQHLLQRRFEEAIDRFLAVQQTEGASDSISSALAAAYHRLAFQTLADQVRRSVRSVRGNQWMFRMGHPADQPLRVRPELLRPNSADQAYPILRES